MLAFRRIAAFMIDYVVIVIYAAALFSVTMLLTDADVEIEAALSSKLRSHFTAFATLTLPVWLYFTIFERSTAQATAGKLLMRIKVVDQSGQRASFFQAGLRNALKFLPWEIAHAAIWYVPGRPFLDPMPTVNVVICVVAQILALGLAMSLFFKNGPAIHDRIAGTEVCG